MNKSINEVIRKSKTPLFIYEEEKIRKNSNSIKAAFGKSNISNNLNVCVSYFANSNPHLHSIFLDEGLKVLIQSIEELKQLQKFNFPVHSLVASPGFLSDEELQTLIQNDVLTNVNCREEIEFILKSSSSCGIRLDISPNQNQRTGIKISEIPCIKKLFKSHNKVPSSIQTYAGTGSTFEELICHADVLFRLWKTHFSDVTDINLGGGFAYEYSNEPDKKHFEWKFYFQKIEQLLKKYGIPEHISISIEPGRDILADTGFLVLRVTRVLDTDALNHKDICTDGSFTLIPSVWVKKRMHDITFYNANLKEKSISTYFGNLLGSSTISCDFILPKKVSCPQSIKKGDFLVIRDIGAYGATQHMEFLNKRPAEEVLILNNDSWKVISRRGAFLDKIRNVPGVDEYYDPS